MSARKKKKQKELAIIKYVTPEDTHETYASGARILIMSPIHVDINFFWDKLIDDVVGETVLEDKDGKRTAQIEKAYEGARHVTREYVSSITMSVQAFKNLAEAVGRVAKGLESAEE